MELNRFMDRVLEAAAAAGLETAEVYYRGGESFSATAIAGNIDSYEVSERRGLSLRGTVNGRMGYASTEAFDEEAVVQLVEGVKESAALSEAPEQDEIFAGDAVYPELPPVETDLDSVGPAERLEICKQMEAAALAADPRIARTEGAGLSVERSTVRLKNSCGLDLSYSDGMYGAYVQPIASENGDTAVSFAVQAGRRLKELDGAALGRQAAEEAAAKLHAAPVASGTYRVVLDRRAMRSLLGVFSGVFSAENAQQKLSLLAGREGSVIAAPCVTLTDDPLLPGGFASCPFDAEGSAARTKTVIREGRLETLLHSRKTARKQGVATTGNARRSGYSGPVRVAPTNLYLQPGEKDRAALLRDIGEGLLITELAGLHAGANPISGDFSLLSKGFAVHGGEKAEPVEQITVAGNFYRLLESIRAVGSDLTFEGGSIGCPSVDAGELKVSGK